MSADLPALQIIAPPPAAPEITPTCVAPPTENTRSVPDDSINIQNASWLVYTLPEFSVPIYQIFPRCVMPLIKTPTHGTLYAPKTENAQRPPNEPQSTPDMSADLPALQIIAPPPAAPEITPTCVAPPTENTRSVPDAPTNIQNASWHVYALPEFSVPIYQIFPRCVMPLIKTPTHGTPYAPKIEIAQQPPDETESFLDTLTDLPAPQIIIPPPIAPYITRPTWIGGAGHDHRSDSHSRPTADLLAKLEASLIDVAGDGHCQYAAALASIAPAEWHLPLLQGSSI